MQELKTKAKADAELESMARKSRIKCFRFDAFGFIDDYRVADVKAQNSLL